MPGKKEKSENIEEIFAQLDEIIEKLEAEESSLEESFKNYEMGMKLVKECNSKIDKVEKQIQILSEETGEQDDEQA